MVGVWDRGGGFGGGFLVVFRAAVDEGFGGWFVG